MNLRIISNFALAVAIFIAAIAGIVIYNKRQAIARTELAKAEAKEASVKEAARKARSEEAAAKANQAAQEAEQKTAEENRKAKEAEAAAARDAASRATDEKTVSANKRATATAEAEKAEAIRAIERAKADAARYQAEMTNKFAVAEQAKATTAAVALEREKLISERKIAEAKLRELEKLNLEELANKLRDWQRDLEDREQALTPDKTIDDLAWTSKEDMVFDADGNLKKIKKVPYLAEKDLSLSSGERKLAKIEREQKERDADQSLKAREEFISKHLDLYKSARIEDRVVDADFYKKAIKTTYSPNDVILTLTKFYEDAFEKEAKEASEKGVSSEGSEESQKDLKKRWEKDSLFYADIIKSFYFQDLVLSILRKRFDDQLENEEQARLKKEHEEFLKKQREEQARLEKERQEKAKAQDKSKEKVKKDWTKRSDFYRDVINSIYPHYKLPEVEETPDNTPPSVITNEVKQSAASSNE